MTPFATTYPASAALIALLDAEAIDLAAPGASWLSKLEGEVSLEPQIVAFASQASSLGAEWTAAKASAASETAYLEGALEYMVTGLAFSSPKAQKIQCALFPALEWAASGAAPISTLYAAFKD